MSIESLESRRLFAVGATITASGTLSLFTGAEDTLDGFISYNQSNDDRIRIELATTADQVNPLFTRDPDPSRITLLQPRGQSEEIANVDVRDAELLGAAIRDVLGAGPLVKVIVLRTGRLGHDRINVSTVETTQMFVARLADVKRIFADTSAGNDDVAVQTRLRVPTTLVGGDGNDTLSGGGGYALLSGGSGNDTIYSRGNSSVIDAGRGNDRISAGSRFVDNISGGSGDDVLLASGSGDLFDSVETVGPNYIPFI